jgi:hypothetical protein
MTAPRRRLCGEASGEDGCQVPRSRDARSAARARSGGAGMPGCLGQLRRPYGGAGKQPARLAAIRSEGEEHNKKPAAGRAGQAETGLRATRGLVRGAPLHSRDLRTVSVLQVSTAKRKH